MEKIKVILNKFVKFVKDNPREFWILVIILALSAFLRLYKIGEYMTFLGDEGRDMIIIRRFLVEFHPPLIGPGTSVGSMYLGPLYYYMMAIPVLLANFSPVGPAVMVAILGVLTVFLIWFIGREWFGKIAGLVSALLYAISPTIIIFSRSSWNPNIMPFFSLLSIYAIWKVWKEKEYKWMIVLGISLAFVLQSHYLGLLLIPTLFIFWLMSPPPKY
ncbi:MAG: glycosyltransferase family 39 protein [Patescibacteria group bacterium]